MSESSIHEFAKIIEGESEGLYGCHSEHRTLVLEYYLNDDSYLNQFEKDSLVNKLDDEFAVLCAINFINIRYDVYYTDKYGHDRLKHVNLGLADILNLNSDTKRVYSIKDHPKSEGVNLSMTIPKGWKAKEGNGPHIIQRFEAVQGYCYVSYMIQINDLPTFFSKREAQEIIGGSKKYGIDIEEMTMHKDAEVLSVSEDEVGNYPARRVEYKSSITRQGITINSYSVAWIIFYEDVSIFLTGNVNTHDTQEIQLYYNLFSIITNSVHFYDQYNDRNYEN